MSKAADDKKTTPMDPTARENRTPEAKPTGERVCYAIKTLNEEVWRLFPETPVEYSNRNGRGVALDVTYDMSALDAGDVYDFTALMLLLGDPAHNDDRRIDSVITDHDTLTVLVSMRPDARTQDRRDPFGLAEAYLILGGEGFAGETDSLDIRDGGSAISTSSDSLQGGGAFEDGSA